MVYQWNLSSNHFRIVLFIILLFICYSNKLNRINFLIKFQAIEKHGYAPLCSFLCSAMQSAHVISNNGEETTLINKLLRYKCESQFEVDKAQEMDFAKKLTVCKDLVMFIKYQPY